MLHFISSLILLLIFFGLWLRRRSHRAHAICMILAFLSDLSLVIYIEVMRHAVEQVTHHMSPLLAFHVTVSVAALLGYVIQIILGILLWKGFQPGRNWHRWVGIFFILCRCANFITSFMVQTHP